MSCMDVKETITWLDQWFDRLIEEKAYLSDLDQKIGDGDHGNNMARGAVATKEALESKQPADVSALFMTVAQTLMSKIGGASGPLYGSAFLAIDRKSTRLNSSHVSISYAVFCLKKKLTKH